VPVNTKRLRCHADETPTPKPATEYSNVLRLTPTTNPAKANASIYWQRNQSSPCSHKTHANSTQEHEQASNDAFAATQDSPAVITQKVLGQQLDKRSEGQQTR
jgi:hypothetical protein